MTSRSSSKGQGASGRVRALLKQMEGITVALCTPLDKGGELDVRGLERLVARVIQGGASCLFPLGWCGEGPLLTDRVRGEMMRETCRLAGGRVPVMVGVSEQSLPRALALARTAKEAGADILLSTPPYSYPVPQELVYQYFQELAARSGLPVVVYQNSEVSVGVEYGTLLRLSETPGIIGVKAYVNYVALQRSFYKAHKPGRFAVMSGDEYTFGAALLAGMRHFTMGGPGNLCPGWCTSIFRSALANDWRAVALKQRRLIEFCDALETGADSAYAAIKYALACLGICEANISSPHRLLPRGQRKAVEKALARYADVVRK